MTQNRSHAVMAQRAPMGSGPHDSLDFFPTPPWAARALCEAVLSIRVSIEENVVWDPACGTGDLLHGLKDYSGGYYGSDIHDYGQGFARHDFLMPFVPYIGTDPAWIVTNPPFRLALQFIKRALGLASGGVAMLVRSTFLEGGDRYRDLFARTPPTIVAPFAERVPMVKGRLDAKASSATAYSWLVWITGAFTAPDETRVVWIPPCRKRLERPDDYTRWRES